MKPIVQEPDPILRQEALAVPESLFGSQKLIDILDDMAEALDAEPDGVALAAPQIGVSYRIFIVRKDRTVMPPPEDASPEERAPEVEVYINPEITKSSRKRQLADEGCLSVRGVYGTVNRHERVSIRAQLANGTRITRGAGGLVAQIFEHEIDHLNGILFIDHAEHLLHLTHPEKEKPQE